MRVTQRGFRSKIVLVITTLRDAEAFSADAIAELYRRRWQAELNLRSLKVVLQMDHLHCKNPHRVSGIPKAGAESLPAFIVVSHFDFQ